jgi:hypothetical protein
MQKNLRMCRSFFDANNFHVATGEIIILKVNQ